MEASLLQAYAPRDPLREYFQGRVSLRQLRLMVEHLPLNAPAYRAAAGHGWTDETLLAWDASSQLRVLNAALANLFREKGAPPVQPDLLPAPGVDGGFSDGDVLDEVEQQEISANLERLWGP
ncbi:hypothetical protein [Brachybacterium paraconglomeratum]|uniref:hypothetical protein n=1 Tax=Brachybacterium paraconglomeratum TaxID=173362 RepID=UPI00026C700D|nr:hypothetical protein [Brachybacterium paraconglomeratum]